MNLKKFVFSSLGAAAFVAGTQTQAGLINLNPAPNAAYFDSSKTWIDYAYNAQSGIGTFTASVVSNGINYDAPGPAEQETFLPATFSFSATINASTLNSPILTHGSFSIVKDAAQNVPIETLLTGILKPGSFGSSGTWGAADSAPTIFEFTFTPNQSGTFWQDFATGGNPGLGGIILGELQADATFINWQTNFATTSPAISTTAVFSINPSFVPEPSSALVGLLLTAGALSNRRRSFAPRAANPSSPA